MEAYCFQAYADALEVIPTTLAENAGLNPIAIVTELRNRHAMGERNAGINIRKVSPMKYSWVDRLADVFRVGSNLKHPRGGRRTTAPGLDKRDRAVDRDCLSLIEDRRLRAIKIDSILYTQRNPSHKVCLSLQASVRRVLIEALRSLSSQRKCQRQLSSSPSRKRRAAKLSLPVARGSSDGMRIFRSPRWIFQLYSKFPRRFYTYLGMATHLRMSPASSAEGLVAFGQRCLRANHTIHEGSRAVGYSILLRSQARQCSMLETQLGDPI